MAVAPQRTLRLPPLLEESECGQLNTQGGSGGGKPPLKSYITMESNAADVRIHAWQVTPKRSLADGPQDQQDHAFKQEPDSKVPRPRYSQHNQRRHLGDKIAKDEHGLELKRQLVWRTGMG